MSEAHAIARELEALAIRLADLGDRVQALEAENSEPENGTPCRLLTAREVQERTGLSRARIYALGREGKAGAIKVGERSVRFSERGLQQWQQRGGAE